MYFWYSDEYIEVDYSKVDYKRNMKKEHHHKEDIELFYLVSGKRKFWVNDILYEVEKGSLLLFDFDEAHRACDAKVDFYEKIVIYISKDFIDKLNTKTEDFDLYNLLEFQNKVIRLSKQEQLVYEGLIFNFIDECKNKDIGFYTRLTSILLELMVMMYRRLNKVNTKIVNEEISGINRIKYIISFIKENGIKENLTLEKVAHTFGISKFYLCRAFKAETGVNFVKYISLARINEAKRLLSETEMSMLKISEQVGYNSLSNFEKTFKKITGITPLRYRKMSRIR